MALSAPSTPLLTLITSPFSLYPLLPRPPPLLLALLLLGRPPKFVEFSLESPEYPGPEGFMGMYVEGCFLRTDVVRNPILGGTDGASCQTQVNFWTLVFGPLLLV